MLGKFFGSIFNDGSTSATAFQVTKHLSDYVGMWMRLAFIALVDRVLWAMFARGAFGGPEGGWFGTAMIYTASAILWVIYIAFIVSIINLTYRCVVEAFDEATGFTGSGIGLGWLVLLTVRIGIGVVVGGYGIFLIIVASVATQNLVKFIGNNPA